MTRSALLLTLGLSGCLYETGDLPVMGPVGPPVATQSPTAFATGVPVDPRITLTFDRHLDPYAVLPADAVRLTSGDRQVELEVRWDPVDRAIVAEPTGPLSPGVRYVFEVVDAAALPDLTGRTLEAAAVENLRTPFTVDEGGLTRPPDDPLIDASDPEAAFREHVLAGPGGCAGCHSARALYLGTDLALDDLAGLIRRVARTSPERVVVVPGRPSRSYLLQKMLLDYPDIGGAPMPLGFDLSDGDRRKALRATEAWIRAATAL